MPRRSESDGSCAARPHRCDTQAPPPAPKTRLPGRPVSADNAGKGMEPKDRAALTHSVGSSREDQLQGLGRGGSERVASGPSLPSISSGRWRRSPRGASSRTRQSCGAEPRDGSRPRSPTCAVAHRVTARGYPDSPAASRRTPRSRCSRDPRLSCPAHRGEAIASRRAGCANDHRTFPCSCSRLPTGRYSVGRLMPASDASWFITTCAPCRYF